MCLSPIRYWQYRNFTQSKWSPVLAGCYQSKINFSFIYLLLSQLHNQSSYLFINTWAILHIYPCAYALYVLPLNIEMCCGLFSHTMYIRVNANTHKWKKRSAKWKAGGQYLELLSILNQPCWNFIIVINVDKKMDHACAIFLKSPWCKDVGIDILSC